MRRDNFEKENYIENETIQTSTNTFYLPLSSNETKNYEIQLQREELISDHKFYSLGIFPSDPIRFTTIPGNV